MSSEEKCSVCLENIDNNEYILPECTHKFHINCILTWFRAGHNCCPLCRNGGVNSGNNSSNMSMMYINNELMQYTWQYRKKLLQDNYLIMRSFSRKANAPKHLKKKVEKLKKMEIKRKKISKELSDFNKSKQPDLTVSKILKKIVHPCSE